MKLILTAETGAAQSRVTYVRLIGMQLRLWQLWRDAAGGHLEALVQMAIGVINGDKVTRGVSEASLRNMVNPMPVAMMTKCNLSSIAAATGINRETVRRIVNRLIVEGRLVRSNDGAINFAPGWTQGTLALCLGQDQLTEFSRTANLLLRDGVFSWEK